MNLETFITNFVEKNTLIRLWYKLPEGSDNNYEEVINGDNPMMEWELKKSKYKDQIVIGVKDILCLKSNYIEAVNLIISK